MRTSSLLLFVLAACSLMGTSPATHNPLRSQLAAADTSRIEEVARSCLEKAGWKVDPVGGESGGANVVGAYTKDKRTDVYIQPPEVTPRITGGPDYGDPFWNCLGSELSSAKGAPPAEPSSEDKP